MYEKHWPFVQRKKSISYMIDFVLNFFSLSTAFYLLSVFLFSVFYAILSI